MNVICVHKSKETNNFEVQTFKRNFVVYLEQGNRFQHLRNSSAWFEKKAPNATPKKLTKELIIRDVVS